jgi:hypothetical protein
MQSAVQNKTNGAAVAAAAAVVAVVAAAVEAVAAVAAVVAAAVVGPLAVVAATARQAHQQAVLAATPRAGGPCRATPRGLSAASSENQSEIQIQIDNRCQMTNRIYISFKSAKRVKFLRT